MFGHSLQLEEIGGCYYLCTYLHCIAGINMDMIVLCSVCGECKGISPWEYVEFLRSSRDDEVFTFVLEARPSMMEPIHLDSFLSPIQYT